MNDYTDLIERLRGCGNRPPCDEDRIEAADEIEMLRDEIEMLRKECKVLDNVRISAMETADIAIQMNSETVDGKELRDWFAGQAVQGMLAAGENYTTKELCVFAYGVADAMMEARGEK